MSRRLRQNNISKLTRGSSQANRSPRPTSRPSSAKASGKPLSSRNRSSQPPTIAVPARRIDTEKSPRPRERRRPANPLFILFLYLLRLSIMGVGIGVIAGTVLNVIKSTQTSVAQSQQPPQPTLTQEASAKPTQAASPASSPLTLTQELTPLKAKLEALGVKYPKLQPGAFFVDLDNGAYVNVQGDTVFSAASTIKIPVLIAFFQDVDAGKIRLDEMLTLKKELIGSGSGEMQYQQVGKKFTALETATKMIIISDNTATNILIDRLGGKEVLNQRFQEWGLTSTVINNALPDLEGTNTTSPKDLANLLAKVNQGELVSLKSRDRILGIMEKTKTRTLLPQGLENDAIIAHKTGDIGTVLGDAGIVDMPSGKRYLGSVLVKRPHNDYTARTLIQEISRTVYQHFKWYLVRPATEPATESQPITQSPPNISNQ